MMNSDLYLEEARLISNRWEKRYDALVTRALIFLQINAALLTLFIFIRNQDEFNGGEALFDLPITALVLSIVCCIVTFTPLIINEIQIKIKFKNIDDDDIKTIKNYLIFEYIEKIKKIKLVYLIKIGFFICAIVFFVSAIFSIKDLILL